MDVNIAFLQLLPGKTQEENLEKGLQACRKVFFCEAAEQFHQSINAKTAISYTEVFNSFCIISLFFNFLSFFQLRTDASYLFSNN